jgi:type VI secretion system protein ImpA
MKRQINIDELLAPLTGENPAGEDLRYAQTYELIKEARRSEEVLEMGDWQREVKTADSGKVISIAVAALTSESKDFQIAAWLGEALAREEGFEGVEFGLKLEQGLLSTFWDTAYPLVEDDDYDYRIAPFEFLNDKITAIIKEIPLTDPRATPGYSYFKWKESRDVGYESDGRKGRREEQVSEGKLTAEEFDTAVAKTSAPFYKALADTLAACIAAFSALDTTIDTAFGSNAPRISDIGLILDECNRMVITICREQKGLKDAIAPATDGSADSPADSDKDSGFVSETAPAPSHISGSGSFTMPLGSGGDETQETALWNEALKIMQGGNFRDALNVLLSAASSQPSERGRNRYRFLVAKLCLKAGRPDLAKPIVEQLHTMINELHLENWESPYWVSEILESLYQCLMSAEYAEEDPARAQELFRRICTLDVTRVIGMRS